MGGAEIHKVLLTVFLSFNRKKRIKTEGLRVDKEEMRGGMSVTQVKGGGGWGGADVEEERGGAFIFKKIKRKELNKQKKKSALNPG